MPASFCILLFSLLSLAPAPPPLGELISANLDVDGDGLATAGDAVAALAYLEIEGLSLEELLAMGTVAESGVVDLSPIFAGLSVPVGFGPKAEAATVNLPRAPRSAEDAVTTGRVLYVPLQYPTIALALAAASPHDTIQVSQNQAGVYRENLDITKDAITICSVQQGVTIEPEDLSRPTIKLKNVSFSLRAAPGATLTLTMPPADGRDPGGTGAIYAHYTSGHTASSKILIEGKVSFQSNRLREPTPLSVLAPVSAAIDIHSEQQVPTCEVAIGSGVSFSANDADTSATEAGAVTIRGPLARVEIYDEVSFLDNKGHRGGGLLIVGATSVSIEDVDFLRNGGYAGADEHRAARGGGARIVALEEVEVLSCRFVGNKTAIGGGGLYVQVPNKGILNALIRDCTFLANDDEVHGGGGLAIDSGNSEKQELLIRVDRCTFDGNKAGADGGGMQVKGPEAVEITNCVFQRNYSALFEIILGASALAQVGSGTEAGLRVYNCTFTQNGDEKYPLNPTIGSRSPDIVSLANCILWGNLGPVDIDPPEHFFTHAFNNDIQDYPADWDPGHQGNLSIDPILFPDGIHIQDPSSPCRNAGKPLTQVTFDWDLDSRVDSIDIGADEFTGFVRGDANDNGLYEVGDAVFILDYVSGGPAPHCSDSADVNDDGSIDIADARYILNDLFAGGPMPPAPFPDCGPDGTMDVELRCDRYDHCP